MNSLNSNPYDWDWFFSLPKEQREVIVYSRRCYIENINGEPNYVDALNGKIVDGKDLDCSFCEKKFILDEGLIIDPCLGKLPGVKNACCGHGLVDGYIQFENGKVVRLKKLKK